MFRQSFSIYLSRQSWLPYKARRSVIKRLWPQMFQGFSFERDFFGLRFSGNVQNYIDRLIYFCGAYEKYMLFLLRDYVGRLKAEKSSLTFIDVGANVGNHSLFMSRLVDSVHAFEPFERVRKRLEETLAQNAITNVHVYPYGLSDEEASLPFYAAPASNLGAASFYRDHKEDNEYLGELALKKGDDVLMAENIQADIIKADVEGFEKHVFQGLQKTLARDRPLVIMELSRKTRETLGSEDALKALFPPRYRLYYFARGNADTGRYRLKSFDYALKPKIEDVIACPEERLSCLGVF